MSDSKSKISASNDLTDHQVDNRLDNIRLFKSNRLLNKSSDYRTSLIAPISDLRLQVYFRASNRSSEQHRTENVES